MAKHLDEQVAAFRNRPLDAGPYAFVWVDALTQKVREGGRIINVHALVAVGVNADGHREILGIDVATAEDGAGWLAFLRSLIARGLSGVQLVISDAHTPTTSVRRRISLFRRSCGLFGQICRQTSRGKAVNASRSDRAAFKWSAALGNLASRASIRCVIWAWTASVSGCSKTVRIRVATHG